MEHMEPKPVCEQVMEALRQVVDPELGIDVVSLGLVYGVVVDGDRVKIELTMTTASCPLGEHIALEARERVGMVTGAREVEVTLVWEPPWTPARMSPEARQRLGWGG